MLSGILLFFTLVLNVSGNLLFSVNHKFKGRDEQVSLSALKEHDARRHGRLLAADAAVDLQLGGNGHPSEAGYVFFCFWSLSSSSSSSFA